MTTSIITITTITNIKSRHHHHIITTSPYHKRVGKWRERSMKRVGKWRMKRAEKCRFTVVTVRGLTHLFITSMVPILWRVKKKAPHQSRTQRWTSGNHDWKISKMAFLKIWKNGAGWRNPLVVRWFSQLPIGGLSPETKTWADDLRVKVTKFLQRTIGSDYMCIYIYTYMCVCACWIFIMRIVCLLYALYIYMCVCVRVCAGVFIPIVIRALVAATLKLQPCAEILLFSELFQPLLCCDWLSEDSPIFGGGMAVHCVSS